MIKGIIDRFEENIAVIEIDGETQDFPKSIFPKNANVGDVVSIKGDIVTILTEETEKLRKEINDLMDELFEE
jgi:hypothetical protein